MTRDGLNIISLTCWLFVPFLISGFLSPSPAAATISNLDKEKNEPLVMENADRFEGYRSRGEYVLSGKVRFRHGTLLLQTERAVWLKDRNIVYCESSMRIVQRGAVLTADKGSYDKNKGEASAEGNVFMRDSSGEVEGKGQSILYQRFKHLTTLRGDPELRRFYAVKEKTDSTIAVSTADSLAHIDVLKGKRLKGSDKNALVKTKVPHDTLIIRGDFMTYDDSTQVAIADGKVRINRDKLKITCKKAEYHDAADSLFLLGEPMVLVDDNQVKGLTMRMGMHGEDIRSLLVKGAAQAHSIEPATDTTVARQSDVQGDSLFLAFKEKAIDSVQVFRSATGTYFDVDKPEYVNKMSGDYMVLRFAGKQVTGANVLGGAKSTYYHFEKKTLKGRNDAEGDSIEFAFKQGKVDEVRVKGRSKGTYFGEKPGKPKLDSVREQTSTKDTALPVSNRPVLNRPVPGEPASSQKPWRKR